MASIFTRKGEEILIDDEDFDFVNQFTWCVCNGYAWTRLRPSKPWERKVVSMHQILKPVSSGMVVDHENGNGLDNRSSRNLKEATNRRNTQKQKKTPTTGIRKLGNVFHARISFREGDKIIEKNLGCHKTFDLALLARIIGEIRYYGEPIQQMP